MYHVIRIKDQWKCENVDVPRMCLHTRAIPNGLKQVVMKYVNVYERALDLFLTSQSIVWIIISSPCSSSFCEEKKHTFEWNK